MAAAPPRPVLLAQLTDLHVGDPGADAALAAAVALLAALAPLPDAVLVTGDVATTPAPAEYDRAGELLGALAMPVHVLAGNHDDPEELHARWRLPGRRGDPLQHTADVGPLRLVLADTTLPGRPEGGLDAERLAWLDAQLAAEPGRPTVVAVHHAPLTTGVRGMDAIGFLPAGRPALAEVLSRHPHVVRVVGGHVHRAAVATLGGRVVVACPSTHRQLELDLTGEALAFGADPPALALHRLDPDGALTTHLVAVPVAGADG